MRHLLTLDRSWNFGEAEYDIMENANECSLSGISAQNRKAAHWGEMIDADDTSADERPY